MKKILLLLLGVMLAAGCSASTPGQTSSSQPGTEMPKDIRAFSVSWQGQQLLYATPDGIFSHSPADGATASILSAAMNEKDWLYSTISPDGSQYIVLTVGPYDNTAEIFDYKTGESVLQLDADKYRQGVGDYSPPVSQVGWMDNENIFLSTEFRLFLISIHTGEEVQITAECAPVTASVNHNTEAPYLSWARNVTQFGDQLYYNSKRSLKEPGLGSIYRGDKTGEQELLKNASLVLAVDGERFVYLRETEPGFMQSFLYDIPTGRSSLISAENALPEGIFRTNEGNLVLITGDPVGGAYRGLHYNPDTLQSQTFDLYNGERDFPDPDVDRRQFGKFFGAFEKDGDCVFLFSAESHSIAQEKFDVRYLAYSVKARKLIEIQDYGDTWLVTLSLDATGSYIAAAKHHRPGDDSFLFDLIRTGDLLARFDS
jgi:hypothetical protein